LLGVGVTLVLLGAAGSNPLEHLDGRIVNGEEAREGEFPYQVSIQISYGTRTSNRGYHFCGGTMISSRFVLTAAHCVKNHRTPKHLLVVAGTTDISDRDSPSYKVLRIIRHEYDDRTKVGDLALLEISKNLAGGSIDRKNMASPIGLCSPDVELEGRKGIVSGWGHLKSKGSSVPDHLRDVEVDILHQSMCERMLDGYPWDGVSRSMICAGGEDKDACQGDSGGPLIVRLDNGERCLAGIVSWGIGCATEGVPGVYTNVRSFDDWIISHADDVNIVTEN